MLRSIPKHTESYLYNFLYVNILFSPQCWRPNPYVGSYSSHLLDRLSTTEPQPHPSPRGASELGTQTQSHIFLGKLIAFPSCAAKDKVTGYTVRAWEFVFIAPGEVSSADQIWRLTGYGRTLEGRVPKGRPVKTSHLLTL